MAASFSAVCLCRHDEECSPLPDGGLCLKLSGTQEEQRLIIHNICSAERVEKCRFKRKPDKQTNKTTEMDQEKKKVSGKKHRGN